MKTLGDYRAMAKLLFGEDSEATKFLEKKIAEQGANEEVVAHESQMMILLGTLHEKKDEKPK